jgi:hypothetical protein
MLLDSEGETEDTGSVECAGDSEKTREQEKKINELKNKVGKRKKNKKNNI